jgi:hypothetical protein
MVREYADVCKGNLLGKAVRDNEVAEVRGAIMAVQIDVSKAAREVPSSLEGVVVRVVQFA